MRHNAIIMAIIHEQRNRILSGFPVKANLADYLGRLGKRLGILLDERVDED